MNEPDICRLDAFPGYLEQAIGVKLAYKTVWRMVKKEKWPGFKIVGTWYVSRAEWRKRLEAMARDSTTTGRAR